jgi:hypothetical protein
MKIDNKTVHFGYFTSLDEAIAKAKEARKIYHGEYRREE